MEAQVLQHAPPGQGQAQEMVVVDSIEIDQEWQGVLGCGAPGPSREAPALFYQAPLPGGRAAPGYERVRKGCSE